MSNPKTEPTDKSICPATITINIPTAKTPVTAVCMVKFDRFRGVRKIPLVIQLGSAEPIIKL